MVTFERLLSQLSCGEGERSSHMTADSAQPRKVTKPFPILWVGSGDETDVLLASFPGHFVRGLPSGGARGGCAAGAHIAGGHSAGIMIETTAAEHGNMDFSQIQLRPFL